MQKFSSVNDGARGEGDFFLELSLDIPKSKTFYTGLPVSVYL